MAPKVALVNIVHTKIALIQTQANELKELLDVLIDKEVSFAMDVEMVKHNVRTTRDVNGRLDAVLDFLLGKCAEIENFTSGSLVHFQTQPVQSNEAASSISGGLGIPEFTDRVTALELAMCEANQTISVLKESTDVQKIQSAGIEDSIKNLAAKIAMMEEMESSKYKSFKKRKKFYESVSINHTEKLEDIQSQLENLISEHSGLSKRLDSKLISLNDMIMQQQHELADVTSSQDENKKETLCLMKTTEDLISDLHKLEIKQKQDGISLFDLWSKVSSHEMAVSNSAVYKINEENHITEFQNRIHVVEEQRLQDLEYYKRKLMETDSLYKQVCQMVDAKVSPLRHLQNILSKYHHVREMQEEASLQTDAAEEVVSSLSGPSCLVSQRQKVEVGFTAYWGEHTTISENEILRFTDVSCNEGACYHRSSGEFTAPYSGLYLTSLTLRQREGGKISAHVKVDLSRFFTCKGEQTVCKAMTHSDKASSSDVGVVRLRAGDKVFVRVMEADSNPRLSFYSGFSCVLIG